MMLSLFTRRLNPFSPSTSTLASQISVAGYATASPSKSKGGRKRPVLSPAQLKDEALRKLLYPRILGKPRVNPVGLHRREVNRALRRVMRSAEAHETIERAWQLQRRQLRETRSETLKLQFQSMENAMEKLKELDKGLYDMARVRVDPRGMLPDDAEEVKALKGPAKKFFMSRVQGLFPREMWIPAETPRKEGWTYEWSAPRSSSSAASKPSA